MNYKITRTVVDEGFFDVIGEARKLRVIANDIEEFRWRFDEQQADGIHHQIGRVETYLKTLAEKLENIVL
jgi:hypothetical protein